MRKEMLALSKAVLDNKTDVALRILDEVIAIKADSPKASSHQSWYTRLNQFRGFYLDHINGNIDSNYKLPFPIFKKGNGKLPFLNYSTVPVVNCPGADACRKWCYSLNSMRFPNATMSWLQNQVLENHHFNIIERELISWLPKFKKHKRIDFRLYNDGDFSSINVMVLWFNLIKKYPKIRAYGYTKSLNLVIELEKMGYDFPENYKFNVSSGGKYDNLGDTGIIRNNKSYRGKFIAYNLNGKKASVTKLSKDDKKQIRQSFNKKIFICPGACGSCTKIGHGCGIDEFKNIDIVIPIH